MFMALFSRTLIRRWPTENGKSADLQSTAARIVHS
jgi:hypothetical protein